MPAGFPKTPGPLNRQIKAHAENHSGICIFDKVEPRSVYNLVPAAVQEAIENVNPEYYKWSEKALEKHAQLDVRDYRLRLAFWNEYYETQDKHKKGMAMGRMIMGVCTNAYWYEEILPNPLKLAWILYPPANYAKAMEEILDLSMRQMRNIMTLNHNRKSGFDIPLIKEKIKIFALIDNRVRGSVLQRVRVDQQAVHAHMHQTSGVQTRSQEAPKSIEELNNEILKLSDNATPMGIKEIEAELVVGTKVNVGDSQVLNQIVGEITQQREDENPNE